MNLLTTLAREAELFIRPLLKTREDPLALEKLLTGMGWTIDTAAIDIAAFDAAIEGALTAARSLQGGIDTTDLARTVAAIDALAGLAVSIQPCLDALNNGLPAGAPADVAGALSADIRDSLVLRYLVSRAPTLHDAFSLLGWIEMTACEPLEVQAVRVRHAQVRPTLRWDRIPAFVQDPFGELASQYLPGLASGAAAGWLGEGGDARWFVSAVRRRLAPVLSALGGSLRVGSDGYISAHRAAALEPATRTLLGRLWVPVRQAAPAPAHGLTFTIVALGPSHTGRLGLHGPGLEVGTSGLTELSTAAGEWTIALTVEGDAPRFFVSADTFVPENGGGRLELRLEATWREDGDPVVIGADAGTRFELGSVTVHGFADLADGAVDFGGGVRINEAALVVSLGDGDSFIASLVPDIDLRLDFALGIALSRLGGLVLEGGGSLALRIPIGKELLGAVAVPYLDLRLGVANGELALDAGATLIASLGPVGFTVENTGLAMVAAFPPDRGGNLGPLDLALRWKPPTALGISVDVADVVSGGGFLYIDADGGEYAGILDLQILAVRIAAVALIDTKLPDGGWSLFLALFIEVPSIPLGFGFTLTGVGGIAGVHRTLDVDGLQSAIRSGALGSVLFPEDPIADAPFVIDGFRAMFPSATGRYVFGPVVQIGWGVPTLIEAEVGIVISVPDPITIAVIGSVTSVLPTADLDLVAIHLDVAGVLDTAAATLAIDASLHDSRIAQYALSGSMSLRAEFGDRPSFLMALGGFHPGFDRPPGFPSMDRLSLAIDAGDQLEVRFDAYFAIASNSLQFGAAFELTAEVDGFGINGGTEFDALVTLAPFSISTHVGFHIAVTGAGVNLASARLNVDLTGPNPWFVVGTATITVLRFDHTIRVDQRIGSARPEPPPAAQDVAGQLRAALALPEAWSVAAGGGGGVTLASDRAAAGVLAVAPDGALGVSQRVVPLGIVIDKGEPWEIVGDYNWFDLEPTGSVTSTGTLTDWFAPASYVDLGPRERLSAPSFERLKSGIEFGGGKPIAGPARAATLEYEQILRDPGMKEDRVKLKRHDYARERRVKLGGALVTAHATSAFTIAPDETPITVAPTRYVAANRVTGAQMGTSSTWTAGRVSNAGRRPAAAIVPGWEMTTREEEVTT